MMSDTELHVVFGASGAIGNAVIRELAKQGRRVRGVNRSGVADVPSTVEMVTGDASVPSSACAACQGASIVYNCANAPYTDWPRRFPPIMSGLIEGAASANARLIFADNLYMYGRVSGPLVEDLPQRPTGKKGEVRVKMAAMLMAAHRAGKVRAVIARASDYFGPGVLNSMMGDRLFESMIAGKTAMWAGRLDAPRTVTYIDDFARALILLAERDDAVGRVWHVPGAEPITGRQFLQMAFEAVGLPSKIGAYTRPVMTLLSPFVPIVREALETLYQFEAPFIVDGCKFEQAFPAFKPTPHREAIRRTVEWFRLRSTVSSPA
jgi:nucleoside-diphosphate-sugar epimerase